MDYLLVRRYTRLVMDTSISVVAAVGPKSEFEFDDWIIEGG